MSEEGKTNNKWLNAILFVVSFLSMSYLFGVMFGLGVKSVSGLVHITINYAGSI